jgi:hypothetical protein
MATMTDSNFLKGRVIQFLFLLGLFPPSSTALALDIPWSLEGGYSYSVLNKGDYKAAKGGWVSADVHFRYLSLEAGYQDLGRFDLKDVSKTHIDVSGYTAGVLKRFRLNDRLSVDTRLGVYAWKADATFLDENVGEDRGYSLWLGAAGHMDLTQRFGLFLSWQWFYDISKANINTLSVGLTLNF